MSGLTQDPESIPDKLTENNRSEKQTYPDIFSVSNELNGPANFSLSSREMKHLPNLITLLNLCCGCAAIVAIFNSQMQQAGIFILSSMVLDFLDGTVARVLKAWSELGKQLDSLADMVSFGLVPGLILYSLYLKGNTFNSFHEPFTEVGAWYMFTVTVFSALRLAKFNIDKRQSTYFIGLPTPANTLLVLSMAFIVEYNELGLGNFILNPWFLIGFVSISSFLLVAEIPLISLKVNSSNLKDNIPAVLLLSASVVLFILFRFAAPPLIIVLYLILSFVFPPKKKPL